MRCSVFLVFGCLAFVAAGTASAQDGNVSPLTLRAALEEAVHANPELIALRREYDATAAVIPQARSLGAPMMETQIWGWPVTTLNPIRTDMYMFMAEQELPGRGKRAARELVASREAQMSKQQVAVRTNEILNDVKKAYAELALARGSASLYERQTPVLQNMADAATLRYASGHSGQHDTVKSIVELARLHTDAVEWQERARMAETRLNVLRGRAPDAPVPLLEESEITVPAAADAERIALERHPEVAMASAIVAREEAELTRLRGERRPDFVVGGGYMLQPGAAGAWTAKAGISWPNAPWSRSGITTAVAAQEKKVEAARARQDVVATTVRRDVREATVRLDAARLRVQLLESTVIPHVEHAFDVARAAYALNRGEFADLLDTERLVLSTEMDHIAARTDIVRAIADFETAVGDVLEN